MSNNNSSRRQPDVKKHKNKTLTGSNTPFYRNYCCKNIVLIRPLRGRFCFIFHPAFQAGLLLFDLRCRSGKIHNMHWHASIFHRMYLHKSFRNKTGVSWWRSQEIIIPGHGSVGSFQIIEHTSKVVEGYLKNQ